MDSKIIELIAQRLELEFPRVKNTVVLIKEGASMPFIARYRKEMTGSLDEVQIGDISKQLDYFEELIRRKETILKSIDGQDKLNPELEEEIKNCWDATVLEDLYLPYKQKRKTRADKAREQGLEPLARIMMAQKEDHIDRRAREFLNDQLATVDEVLQGARDIMAEWMNENQYARNRIRQLFERNAMIYSKVVKGKEEEGHKYRDYFDYSESLKRCPSHRMLAIRRGEEEGFLSVTIQPEKDQALEILEKIFIKQDNESGSQVEIAIADAYKRLLLPSMETEFRNKSKQKADEDAILVFSNNLRQLLLEAPLGQKRVLAIDPGYKSGCKIVCLDERGGLEHNQNIYPFGQEGDKRKASKQLKTLVNMFKIDAIAIGNGTASRETEAMVTSIRFDRDVKAFVVSEDGASVYSASEIAREEFEKYDVTVRGAVSIGRRLMDPLAELVKIDPKSIGVGQYQHDVDQAMLKSALERVTESCVNLVGVNLNTASRHILTFISGLGPQLAQNIVDYRRENGGFRSRSELKKVKRMGAKAFEQCAAFLRIKGAVNPLDDSAVHPESYGVVEQMAADLKVSVPELMRSADIQKKIEVGRYVNEDVGLPTLQDIIKELAKPGLDPRQQIKVFSFDKNVRTVDDLEEGMILAGIVTNITNFGAFIDVGVKQDGLVHVSEMADRFISDPNEVVRLHQHIKVRVLSVDQARKRIAFSLKNISATTAT